MMTPYYLDHDVALHHGHVLNVLPTLAADSVQTCVTSPPYYGLRDYGVDGQIGLEPSPAEYVETLRAVFAEVRRVLRPDGTLWLNLGDSYVTGPSGPRTNSGTLVGSPNSKTTAAGAGDKRGAGLPEKNLLGVPWRVAFALQSDGWYLRNAIIWNKPNAMPESVTDRLSCRYEHVFLFSKSRSYWFDLDPIREPLTRPEALNEGLVFGGNAPDVGRRRGSTYQNKTPRHTAAADNTGCKTHEAHPHPKGRNPGDVWELATQPFPGAHFAVFPPALVRRCILAGSPEHATILDPFAGSGTTLMVARQLNRRSVGIELNRAYLELAVKRIGDPPFDFGEAVS